MTVKPDLDRLLREAIQTKHLIRFRYKNQERIVEPHDYGIQNGIARLFCYQAGGQSSSPLPGWRLVDVSEMQDCEMLEQRFAGNRETPSGKHRKWDEVFIRVAPPSNRP
jgi:predicted DNA-binding transcriptional regulator YafY